MRARAGGGRAPHDAGVPRHDTPHVRGAGAERGAAAAGNGGSCWCIAAVYGRCLAGGAGGRWCVLELELELIQTYMK